MEVDQSTEKTDTAKESSLTTENPNLTASQSSLRSQPDYDSSATLSADEGPGGPKSHDDREPRDGQLYNLNSFDNNLLDVNMV